MRLPIMIGGGVFTAVVLLLVLTGSFYQIDQGERGVILRNGAVVGTAEPGLHTKTPFMDTVHEISVQSRIIRFENEPVYSSDRQSANITFSINYAPMAGEVATIYSRYTTLEGFEARELAGKSRQSIKNVFGRFTADTAIRERGRLSAEVLDAVSGLGSGLVKIESLQIENIDFSDVVEKAAEERAKAEMLVQTKKQELESARVDAEIVKTNAQAAADSAVINAESVAQAKRLAGDAEADAIKAKGAALRDNPQLVDLIQAEKWSGNLPITMVPGATVPFLNLN